MYGKIEKSMSRATCDNEDPPPTNGAVGLPEGKLQSTSFEAEGKTEPSNVSQINGSKTSPDGRTKISWNLRLVKPKGKK